MVQIWQDLLFAHWRVPEEHLRRVVPPQLPVDTFEGAGWIGVVPFMIRGARLPLTPPMPWLSQFPELNVRTYVTVNGRPGVYFLSLDAASALAVFAARRTYRLPYFRAAMSTVRQGGEVVYSSERHSGGGEAAGFRARYRPHGPAFTAEPSSLEFFLTERYCLCARRMRSSPGAACAPRRWTARSQSCSRPIRAATTPGPGPQRWRTPTATAT